METNLKINSINIFVSRGPEGTRDISILTHLDSELTFHFALGIQGAWYGRIIAAAEGKSESALFITRIH